MSPSTPYFRIKLLSVRQSNDGGLTWSDYSVTQETKDNLWSQNYVLINDRHYHPDEFVNYMNNIMNENNNIIYNVYFKYIFFNHPIDNEYQNTFCLKNNEMKLLI
jgi:hypothetical protein